MNTATRLKSYIIHRISCLSGRIDHAFVSAFRREVLCDDIRYPEYQLIAKFRAELARDKRLVQPSNHGAGSFSRRKSRTIGSLAKRLSVNAKYGQLLFRLAHHYKPDQIIELGTAFGISTLYLALGHPGAAITTIEGNSQLAGIASENFSSCGLKNITLINSTFEDAIPSILPVMKTNTMVFIDGNHTLDATLHYHSLFTRAAGFSGILVLDDINWSDAMAEAWRRISGTEGRGLHIDLCRMGIIFPTPETGIQKFWLRV